MPVPRRALLSVSDKSGLADLGRGLVAPGLRAGLHRGHGPGAARGRPAGHGRRRRHRLPRDARRPGQDAPPAGPRRASWRTCAAPTTGGSWPPPAIEPFELVAVNLYPFAAAAERPGIAIDDARRGDRHRRAVDGPRRGQEPRRVAIVTDRRGRRRCSRSWRARRRRRSAALGAGGRGVPPHGRLRRADRRRAAARASTAGVALPDEPGCPAPPTRIPPTLTIALEKVETLRYGENPHQPAARYRAGPRAAAAGGPFARGVPPLQGKAL